MRAHAYANILGPIINNIGNILYVLVAMAGGIFLLSDVPNFSLSGMAFSISIVVPFLNMTKQFTGNVNQLSQQINSIVMAMAGAERIFTLMDMEPESDEGYVTLVNAKTVNGNVCESDKKTGEWAWKHPHSDGSVTYTPLLGM
jgi:ATP-binding cassette subfamily B protein